MRWLHSHQGVVFNVPSASWNQKGSTFKKTFNDTGIAKLGLGLCIRKIGRQIPSPFHWAVPAHFPSVSITVKSDNNFLLVGFLWMLNEVIWIGKHPSHSAYMETIQTLSVAWLFLMFPDSFLWKQYGSEGSDRCPWPFYHSASFVIWLTSHFGTWFSFKSKILYVLETQLKSCNQRKVMLMYKYWKRMIISQGKQQNTLKRHGTIFKC